MAVTSLAAELEAHPALPRVTTLRLLAGRGSFRTAGQLMALVLAVVWGARTYAWFANAVGVCGWLVFLPTAAEKAALNLVPRSARLASDVARLAVRTALAPTAASATLLLAAVAATAAFGWPGATVELYLATATWSVTAGALMTLSGLHRLQRRAGLDARAFGTMSAIIGVVTGITALAHLRPEAHALLLVAGAAPLVAASFLALPPGWRRGRTRRRLARVFAGRMLLLGLSELVDAVALAALFALLAAFGRIGECGPLYLAVMPFGVLCSFVLYLMRLRQPATSSRLRGTGAAAGRAEALRMLRLVERVGAPLTLVVGAAALTAVTRADLSTPQLYAVLALIGLLETGCWLGVLYASYLLENTTADVLVRTGNTALARLAVAVVVATLLVPPFGAAGAYLALVVSLVVHAGLLRRLVRRLPPAAGPATVSWPDHRPTDFS